MEQPLARRRAWPRQWAALIPGLAGALLAGGAAGLQLSHFPTRGEPSGRAPQPLVPPLRRMYLNSQTIAVAALH